MFGPDSIRKRLETKVVNVAPFHSSEFPKQDTVPRMLFSKCFGYLLTQNDGEQEFIEASKVCESLH